MVGGLRPEGAASAWLSRSTGEAIKPPFYFLVGTMNQNLISANGHQAVACMSGGRTEERLHPSSGEVRCVVQIPRRLVAAQVYPEGPGSLVPIPAVLILGRGLGVVDRLDREPERLHLLEQHLEARRHAGLRYVLALDDGLIALDAPDPIVALYRQQLLQGMRRAVGLERPHLHLAEPLSAELRLAAERLLRDQRVRTRAPRVDLVVHQVQELQYVHVTDRDPAVERLACAPVIQRHLAAAAHAYVSGTVAANALDGLIYVVDLGAREDGRGDEGRLAAVLAEALACGPPEVGLEDLAYIHPARHAERTQDNVHRRPVLHERHVLFGHDLGDDPLVAVPTRELVALRDLALCGDEDPHHLVDAGLELVALVPAEALDVYDDAASPCGTFSEESLTSRAFSPKIARRSFSSGVGSDSPLGVTLPTSTSPEPTSAPMRMMPSTSRFIRTSSEALGMSRVISSGPSLVSRACTSYSSMCMEERVSSLTSLSEMIMASSKLNPSHGMKATSKFWPRPSSP